MSDSFSFFLPCPRGLEGVLAEEIAPLGVHAIQPTEGGVSCQGDLPHLYALNLESRIASRVLWQLGRGTYRTEADIYRFVLSIDWPALFEVDHYIRVNVTATKSPLKSLNFVTLKVKDAICDRFRQATGGERPSIDTAEPDQRIMVHLTDHQVFVYLDTSGEALFKRGWRQHTNEAPLRENLAAGILALAGWRVGMPLFDPMCGSGTFLIEAAEKALNRPAGMRRRFAFELFKTFNEAEWESFRSARLAQMITPDEPLPIFGSDLYGDALIAARANLDYAGLEKVVTLKQCNLLEAKAPAEQGLLITNPPYGVRLEEQDHLNALYPEIGHWLKQKMVGWKACFLTADAQLAKRIRLSASRRTPLFNGALECRLFSYDIVSGSHRQK